MFASYAHYLEKRPLKRRIYIALLVLSLFFIFLSPLEKIKPPVDWLIRINIENAKGNEYK